MNPAEIAITRVAVPVEGIEVRSSGAGDGQFTVQGHASVFGRRSLDLGGFKEIIEPRAFSDVLDRNPDVHMVWDHNTSLTLARTRNKTLDLREDPHGLHVWARIAPTSYAADLRVLLERGDVDQMSFAFRIGEESWDEDEDGTVISRVKTVSDLFDVTVCAQGAYPQTDVSLVRARFQSAVDLGRIRSRSEETPAEQPETAEPEGETVAQDDPVGGDTRRRWKASAARAALQHP